MLKNKYGISLWKHRYPSYDGWVESGGAPVEIMMRRSDTPKARASIIKRYMFMYSSSIPDFEVLEDVLYIYQCLDTGVEIEPKQLRVLTLP